MYTQDYSPKQDNHPLKGTPWHDQYLRLVALDSLHDALTYPGDSRYKNGVDAVKNHDREYSDSPRNRWYGCTPAAAEERLRSGWQDGASRINQLELTDLPTPRVIKRTRSWTDEGDELSIDRLYRGEVDSMWQKMMPRTRTGVLRVTLFAEMSINSNTEQSALFWRGATALRLADLLQSAGYAVRIVVAGSVNDLANKSGHQLNWVGHWTAKHHSEPLDMDNLAVTVASAAFYRRQFFRLFDHLPPGCSQSWCLGHAGAGLSDAVAAWMASETDDLLIKVGERVTDQQSANSWLKSLGQQMPQIFVDE